MAVMPFKNANGTSRLDWLRLGIAETMITDLKRSGKVSVVDPAEGRAWSMKSLARLSLKAAESGTEGEIGRPSHDRHRVPSIGQGAGAAYARGRHLGTAQIGVRRWPSLGCGWGNATQATGSPCFLVRERGEAPGK